MRGSHQQVSCRFDIRTERIVATVIVDTETCLHDEQIRIVVLQNSVSVADTIQIVMLERITYPGHVDIVQVNHVDSSSVFVQHSICIAM